MCGRKRIEKTAQLHIIFKSKVYKEPLSNLGVRKKLSNFSQKRITKEVRQVLRRKFGHNKVKVSCKANFNRHLQRWEGEYKINSNTYSFYVY